MYHWIQIVLGTCLHPLLLLAKQRRLTRYFQNLLLSLLVRKKCYLFNTYNSYRDPVLKRNIN